VRAADDWALLPELCQVRAETIVIAVLDEATLPVSVRALTAGAAGIPPRDAAPAGHARGIRRCGTRQQSCANHGSSSSDSENLKTAGLRNLLDCRSSERDWLRQLTHGEERRQAGPRGVPFRNPVKLGSLGVLVHESTEDLVATYPPSIQVHDWWRERLSIGWSLSTALMRAMPVVVRQILAQHGKQMAGVVDQDPVQALPAYRTHPALA
jgi:hypothetical protein